MKISKAVNYIVILCIVFYMFMSALVIDYADSIQEKNKDMEVIVSMAQVTVELVPSKTSVVAGEKFSVGVKVSPDTVTMAGLQLNLGFNPVAISIDSVDQGIFFGDQENYFNGGTLDASAGVIKNILGVSIGSGSGITTPGMFCHVYCTALKAGESSAFVLTNVIAGDQNGIALPLVLKINQVVILSMYDLNGDGKVNEIELIKVIRAFGTSGAAGEDVNKDGIVNILDAILIGQNWAN